jgi:CRISPR/Cas system Type II protein with McrA/HNH and RuvC-like nuclease domain
MKINRRAVYEKTGGCCAYCGTRLEFKRMQVDHIEPKRRGCDNGGSDNIVNLLPACAKCNRSKTVYSLNEFRAKLKHDVERLFNNAQFNNALRFGQIEIVDKPIVFWFERAAPQDNVEWPKTHLTTGKETPCS